MWRNLCSKGGWKLTLNDVMLIRPRAPELPWAFEETWDACSRTSQYYNPLIQQERKTFSLDEGAPRFSRLGWFVSHPPRSLSFHPCVLILVVISSSPVRHLISLVFSGQTGTVQHDSKYSSSHSLSSAVRPTCQEPNKNNHKLKTHSLIFVVAFTSLLASILSLITH